VPAWGPIASESPPEFVTGAARADNSKNYVIRRSQSRTCTYSDRFWGMMISPFWAALRTSSTWLCAFSFCIRLARWRVAV